MQEFRIMIHSFQDMEQFVSLAIGQPFEVTVASCGKHSNGKNYMGMSTLDFSEPLQVLVDCTDAELDRFRREVAAFLI